MNSFDDNEAINVYNGTPDDLIINSQKSDDLYSKINIKLLSRGLPIQAVFEITPLCNLKCKMCFVRLDKEQMDSIGKPLTAAQWKDITEQTAEMGTYCLLITGGEPFIHPEFVEIYENIMKTGFRVILFTNAVMLNDKIIEVLKKYPPNFLYITIYGASEETYEKVCGNGKAYYSVINNLKILKDTLKNIPMSLRITVIKDNRDDVLKVAELAKEMGMKFTYGFALFKPVRGARNDIEKVRLSPGELIDAKRGYIKYIKNKKAYDLSKKIVDEYADYIFNYNGDNIEITDEIRKSNCMAASQIYVITWDGKMVPCQNMERPFTLPLENGLKAAWDELRKYKSGMKVPVRCIRCKHRYYCGTCPAASQTESGSYLDNESYECMQAKEINNKII